MESRAQGLVFKAFEQFFDFGIAQEGGRVAATAEFFLEAWGQLVLEVGRDIAAVFGFELGDEIAA